MKARLTSLILISTALSACGDDATTTPNDATATDTTSSDTMTDTGTEDTTTGGPCEAVDCGTGGECEVQDGAPVCVCGEGFELLEGVCSAISTGDGPTLVNVPETARVGLGQAGMHDADAADGEGAVVFSISDDTCTFNVSIDATSGQIDWTCNASAESCGVTVAASDDVGTTDGVLTIICENALPTVRDVAVSPDPIPELGTVLSCSYTFEDADGSEDLSTIEWIVNGTVVSTEATLGEYAGFDAISCRVTPRDAFGAGLEVTSEVVFAPGHPPASLVAAGVWHACGLVGERVACWGRNHRGGLGDGTTDDSPEAVWTDDRIMETPISGLTVGEDHSCAITNGGLRCWGSNSFGQVGSGATGGDRLRPVATFQDEAGVTAVEAGRFHTCAVRNGAAQCWGYNQFGQIGDGSTDTRSGPRQVSGLTSGVTAVVAAETHSCAVRNGAVWCWGAGSQGKLGTGSEDNTLTPAAVEGLTSGVTALAASFQHTCAIQNGGAFCWGRNVSNELGSGNMVGQPSQKLVPTAVVGLASSVTAIGAGHSFTCAIHDGAVKCWGRVPPAQTTTYPPATVAGLETGVTQLAVGASTICVVQNGALRCLGVNTYGELGDGTQDPSGEAVDVRLP